MLSGQAVDLESPLLPSAPEELKYDGPPPSYVQTYPKITKGIKVTNDNLLENFFFPAALGLVFYLTDQLKACEGNNNQNDLVEYGAISIALIYAVTHLSRSAYLAITSHSEYKEALVKNAVVTRPEVEGMVSTKVHNGVQFFSAATVGLVTTSSVLFAKDQFEYGTVAAWAALITYIVNSLLRRKEGEANYLLITKAEFQQSMSNAQKRSLTIGGGVAVIGAIVMAIEDHLVKAELKSGGTNTHEIPTLVAQAVMISGFAIMSTYSSLRGADATQSAIQIKLPAVLNNEATLFGRFSVRRDLTNMASAAMNTVFLSSMAIAFSLSPDIALKYLPFLCCSLGLVGSLKLTAGQYANDLASVSAKLEEAGATSRRPK